MQQATKNYLLSKKVNINFVFLFYKTRKKWEKLNLEVNICENWYLINVEWIFNSTEGKQNQRMQFILFFKTI